MATDVALKQRELLNAIEQNAKELRDSLQKLNLIPTREETPKVVPTTTQTAIPIPQTTTTVLDFRSLFDLQMDGFHQTLANHLMNVVQDS